MKAPLIALTGILLSGTALAAPIGSGNPHTSYCSIERLLDLDQYLSPVVAQHDSLFSLDADSSQPMPTKRWTNGLAQDRAHSSMLSLTKETSNELLSAAFDRMSDCRLASCRFQLSL